MQAPRRRRYLARPAPGYGEAAAGDHLQLGWALLAPGHQLEHGRAPWADPYSFRPEAEASPNLQGWLLGAPVLAAARALLGNVWAYNLVVLLSFVAAGGLACWWLRALGLSRGAALAGGLVFALAPYRVGQSTGHLLGLIAFLLPAVAARPRAAALRLGRRSRSRRSRSRGRSTSRWAPSCSRSATPGPAFRDADWWKAGAARARGGGRGDRRAAGRRGGLDRGRRPLVRAGAALLGRALRLRHAGRRGGDRGARLRRLADAAPRASPDCGRSAGSAGSRLCLGLARARPLPARARLRTCRSTSRSGTRSRRSASRASRSGCCRSAASRSPPSSRSPSTRAAHRVRVAPSHKRGRRRGSRRRGARAARARPARPVFAAVDRRSRRTPPTQRSGGGGRMLELPVFRPDIHYGSVYLGYARQSPRERPQGYSTTAPPAADRPRPGAARALVRPWDGPAGARRPLRRRPPRSLRAERLLRAGLRGPRRDRAAPSRLAAARARRSRLQLAISMT